MAKSSDMYVYSHKSGFGNDLHYSVKRVDGDFMIEFKINGERAGGVMLPGECAEGVARWIIENVGE